jgi:hypothetical protein
MLTKKNSAPDIMTIPSAIPTRSPALSESQPPGMVVSIMDKTEEGHHPTDLLERKPAKLLHVHREEVFGELEGNIAKAVNHQHPGDQTA